jgi:hypothetical protein
MTCIVAIEPKEKVGCIRIGVLCPPDRDHRKKPDDDESTAKSFTAVERKRVTSNSQ